jgi:uncharacterized protein (TIGR03000 family)
MYRKAILPSALLSLVAAGLVLVSTPGQAQAQRGAIYGGVRVGGVSVGGFAGRGYYGGGYYGGGFGRGYYGSGFYPGYGFGYSRGYYGSGFYPGYGYGYTRGYAYPYAYSGLTYSYPATTYNYPATTYSYPSTAYVAPQSGVVLSTSGYSPIDSGAGFTTGRASVGAVITAKVPDNAEVWFGDHRTSSTGPARTFESPPLEPGRDYSYNIKARWQQDGREVTQTKKVDVWPGAQVSVEFPRPEE